MEHHFEVTIAKDYGIEEAIMLHYFYFWIARNAANEENYHEGLYWTYNTRGFYAEIFIYMSESKVYRVINRLIDEGLLVKGDYNTNRWKRPTWYALTLKGLEYLKEKGYDMTPFGGVLQNDTHVCSKMNNRDGENEQSINNYSNSNTNSNKEIEDTCISSPKKENERFVKPTIQEIQAHILEKGYTFDAEAFYAFYESNGWKVGRNPMKNWKMACTTWAKNRKSNNGNYGTNRSNTEKFYDTIQSANEFSQKLHERVGNQTEMGNGDSDTLW
jgi:DNA-binding PadR family transcriptional regulator